MKNKIMITIKDVRNDLMAKGEDSEFFSIFQMTPDMKRLFFF
jgi:hypothetical protein|tara:strand:- start:1064 stop:1189 length:126 start_codon:yes stop_codon:yes gene_type:complete